MEVPFYAKYKWFYIWLLAIGVCYLIELLLQKRQLAKFYEKNRPTQIKKHVKKSEFKKCQNYSRDKMQMSILSNYLTILLTVVIWYMGWPSWFWDKSEKWVISKLVSEDTKLDDSYVLLVIDFWHGTFLSLFLGFISYLVSAPLELINTFLVQESHGYNNQTLKGWLKD